MKYPAIYKSVEGSKYLYQNKDSYYCYERQLWDSSEPHHDCHHSDTNITHEYLSNTWGVVESKEHAEFIIELAELYGLGFYDDDESRMFFTFNEDSKLFFYSSEDDLNKSRCKQITIPLPPKAKEWPRDKSSDIPQNEKRNKSKQAYEILKSLNYDYDLDKQIWFKKHYI